MANHTDTHEHDDDVKARAAWHYYVEGLTQERIAELLGLGRVKVHRLLSAAREEGIIQFKIRSRIAECVSLQSALVEKYGLSEAIVVPSAADNRHAPKMVGHAAGEHLAARISPGDVIGIGWGRTIKAAIGQIPKRSVPRSIVVSLLGGLTHSAPLNPAGAAVELASRFDAECYVLPVPVFADRPEDQVVFMNQRSIKDVLHWARRANIAVVSAGDFSRENPIAHFGFILSSEWDELECAGAVGDILGHFIDAQGKLVDHPVNKRACSLPFSDLVNIPAIVLVSGGREKIDVIHAALSFMRVTTLVTDEDAARGLLAK
jgi:DNA-binding transcriptional regulator LsrR (DeoR family)